MNSPPTATQFKKGISGNRAGRPRGSRSKKKLAIEARDFKVLREVAGRKKWMRLIDAVLSALSQLASAKVSFAKIRDRVDAHLSLEGGNPDLGVMLYWKPNPVTWREDLKKQQDDLQRLAAELEGSLLGGYQRKSGDPR